MQPLLDALTPWFDEATRRAGAADLSPVHEPRGRVLRIADEVATVEGLPDTRLNEILVFANGTRGIAALLDESSIGCILLGPQVGILAGSIVRGTGTVAQVPVGDALLGRVVDPLGAPLDGRDAPSTTTRAPVEKPAPSIVDRAPVTEPLFTGVTAIDAMLPLGRGQRELLIGDHSTGKSSIAVDTIIRQRTTDVVCVYAAIGRRSSSVAASIEAIQTLGCKERSICVVASGDAAPGLQWLAPYAACSIAEYFTERGGHALLVLDDLTKHAQVHRQISLLLREPPGREAYPGDVFYLHSRLLERAARLTPERGGGSLTVLPVAETQAGNLSAYIPTNLISITDGQIFFEPRLFNEGIRPAIDVGKSVSRVGGHTQSPAMRAVAEKLRLDYAQFLELELFTRIEGGGDEATRRSLERGRRVRAALVQPALAPLSQGEQVALLCALDGGALDDSPVEAVASVRRDLRAALESACAPILERLDAGEAPTGAERGALTAVVRELARATREGADHATG
ncbi:MAG TPA: F0F1 ATP synthase subunit alpha [Polyangiaceae bacterium]|jgi:F-type H+-transporting ATPase subunit alpha